jgi:hypothetical protein
MYSGAAKDLVQRMGMNPDQQVTTALTKQRNEQMAANEKAMQEQGAKRLLIERANSSISAGRLAVEQQRAGFEANGGISESAKSAVQGDLDPLTVRRMITKNPGLLDQMKKLDPNFSEADLENRYSTLKEFTSTNIGKAGGQALALNTLVHHADLYMQTAEALHNGTFNPGNAVYNAVATAFGSAPPTEAGLVGRFLAGETGKVATGGVPAEGEINGILKSLGTDASPDQIKGAAQSMLQIAAGRAVPLQERVEQAKLGNVVHVLGPDAQEILQRRGFDPKTMKPVAPAAAPVAQGGYIVGRKYGNLTYAGGDPNNKANWK